MRISVYKIIRTAFLVLVSGVTAWAALANVTYDQEYDVFYQQQFHVLFDRVQAAVPRAYERVTRLWGLDYPGLLHPLKVQVKDIPSDTLRRWKAAYVEARGQGNSLRQTLVVDIGCYMQNPHEDLDRLITHEMAHVVLQDIQAVPQAAPIPAWFNEGLAQSVTNEGRLRVRGDVELLKDSGESLLLCDLDGPVDEFAHGPYNASCYPEYYLAVQRLRAKGGPGTLSKILKGLQQGTKLPDLLPSLIGMDWPDFKREVDRYTRDVFTGAKPIP